MKRLGKWYNCVSFPQKSTDGIKTETTEKKEVTLKQGLELSSHKIVDSYDTPENM